MKIAIYARVSTQSQAKQDTVQPQIEALRDYAQAHDLTITHACIDNGVSGSTLERDGLDELRDLALAVEVEGVLALSPDRLSRVQFDKGDIHCNSPIQSRITSRASLTLPI